MGLGLLAIGVQYAFLWGFVAAVFRYVPYIGIWIAALPPIILSVAMFEGWVQPLLVIGLFRTIELLAGNVAEPRLYGRSIGVSEVALLVAAAFWAFLWGPIGSVLPAPTVCLVVLGKYVPPLKFLDVLLGDEPPLDVARHLLPAAACPRPGRGDATGPGAGKGVFAGQVDDEHLGPGLELCETGPRARRPDGIRGAVHPPGDAGDPGRPGRAAGGCSGKGGDPPGRSDQRLRDDRTPHVGVPGP